VKLKDPNPLDVLELRRVKFCPPHFANITVSKRYNMEQAICDWITESLSGRYFFGNSVILDDNNNITQVYQIGFESQKELSFFMLACPHLKYN
jgi:hypothetical protein|tara:strand:+ start:133 stop:411 length:279 start_codon:yes stop_codon:yes gene_type:complete